MGCLLVVGILLSLTGVGAIIGIPMILIAGGAMWMNATSSSLKQTSDLLDTATKKIQAKNAKDIAMKNALKGNCPYCGYENTCRPSTPGIDCPACNQRIIIRNNSFLTLADTQDETVVRPQLVPVTPEVSPEERKAAIERQKKRIKKFFTIVIYIAIGCLDLVMCFLDLCYIPVFSLLVFSLILYGPAIVWKSRQQTKQRRYPTGIILFSLFAASLSLWLLWVLNQNNFGLP